MFIFNKSKYLNVSAEVEKRSGFKHLGDDVYEWANLSSSFYAVFDGHGGAEAASYVKEHAMRLSFESSDLPEATTLDGSVDELKGVAKQMSNDHRPSNLLEEKRVKEPGGHFEDGYLNSELTVTRALGNRCMKSESPLIAEPEMTQMVLNKDDEFMIIGFDGI
ncbi:probable protein phosphatase 2C 47 [Tanacetum coccineum]